MDPLKPLIHALHGQSRLRVWSLVITVFGDLVQHRGGVISTARLGALMARVGIESGTLRTALSRLSRDGWIERERTGRTSLCRLSALGTDQFAPATSLIYAPPRSRAIARWSLCVSLDGGAQRVRLVPAGAVPEGADCIVTGQLDQLSPAYRKTLTDPDMIASLDAVARDLATLNSVELTDPLDAAAARMLLIHRWRRLVLRHGDPIPDLLPDDAPLKHPRASVARAYAALSPLAEGWLDRPFAGLSGLPDPDQPAGHRFADAEGLDLSANRGKSGA